VRGRDIEAQQLAATFDKETCRWNVGGDASEARRSEAWSVICKALHTEEMTPQELAAETGLKGNTVRTTLRRMVREGAVMKVEGKYKLTATAPEQGESPEGV
jgi:predicted Rossmann fold nucleotide-binding protein DprA/Smf involved in DNA uptake